MSNTTGVTAGEIMDRVAQLLNDPAKTDYTYLVQIPYLNMAIDELIESLEELHAATHNFTSFPIIVPIGQSYIYPTPELPDTPPPGIAVYPGNLVEVQEVLERTQGANEAFISLPRYEYTKSYPLTDSLTFWAWEHQVIAFNPVGANKVKEVVLRYISHTITQVTGPTTLVPIINSRSYLSFKTAALCAMFIGENQTRAQILEAQADESLERITSIGNKGRQQMMTRHRPFRAGYKARGGF